MTLCHIDLHQSNMWNELVLERLKLYILQVCLTCHSYNLSHIRNQSKDIVKVIFVYELILKFVPRIIWSRSWQCLQFLICHKCRRRVPGLPFSKASRDGITLRHSITGDSWWNASVYFHNTSMPWHNASDSSMCHKLCDAGWDCGNVDENSICLWWNNSCHVTSHIINHTKYIW